jgi:hypothetical protein
MNKPFPPPIEPDPTLPAPMPPPPVPGPADWATATDLPAPGAPQNETPISMLPQGSPPSGSEWLPMVQGGITVKNQLDTLLNFIQLPTPVAVNLGGTGATYFSPFALIYGGPTQFGSITPEPGGSVLVGGTPPHFTTVGAVGTFLQGQGAGNDPIFTPLAGIPGPPGAIGPAGPQGVQGNHGVQGAQGPQGFQGPAGLTGPPGQSVLVVGSFTTKSPALLPPSGLIPANWDSAGNPPAQVQLKLGQGLVYTPTNEVWEYVGTTYTPVGWVDLGAVQGPTGSTGAQGPSGPQGPVGASGGSGAQGPVGPQGPTGLTGPQGQQGVPGPAGATGPQGITGPQGNQGVAGPQGSTGNPGAAAQSVIIVGTFTTNAPSALPPSGFLPINWDSSGNPPSNVQMQLGQGLVYTNTSAIWSYVGTSVSPAGWANVGNAVGPPGPQGVPGPAGANGGPGPTGPTGPAGPAGSAGPSGGAGPVGPSGPAGPTGGAGPSGPQGSTGLTGAQGPVGPQGPAGAAGQATVIVGQFGASKTPANLPPNGVIPANWDAAGVPPATLTMQVGQSLLYTVNQHLWAYVGVGTTTAGWIDLGANQGPAGPQGAPGPSGPTGPTGPIGPQGPIGVTGPHGPIGPTGVSADAGNQATLGSDHLVYVPTEPGTVISPTPPASAQVGELWWDSTGGELYIWYNDGTSSQWVAASPSTGIQDAPSDNILYGRQSGAWSATMTISDTAPSSPAVGALWWDSVGGQLYIWYSDPNTSQWVIAVNAASALPPASTTVLGGVKVDGTSIKAAIDGTISTVLIPIGDNRIRNGDMRIDQRNNGASGTAQGYTVDGWVVANLASVGTWGRNLNAVTGPPVGFPYYHGFQSSSAHVSAATDSFSLYQAIEADMISDFAWGTANAQPVTLSFWVYSSLTGAFSGAVKNFAQTRSYPFTYSVPAANTWTKIAITIPGDTAGTWVMSGNAGGMYLQFDLGSGTNNRGPANAWASAGYNGVTGSVSVIATNAATFYLTGVKLEVGSVATPYNRQSLAKSLADCQRYYQTIAVAARSYATVTSGFATNLYWAPMRASPTGTLITAGSRGNVASIVFGQYQVNSGVLSWNSVAAGDMYILGDIWSLAAEL